jgi:putative nucleotidyltransferase with HDIG domain
MREFAKVLSASGRRCFLVGGAVRDYFLGRPVNDFDVATDARPEEVMKIYRRVIPTGVQHGTVTVLWKGMKIEVTTFRTEADYGDARHPDSISYAASIEEDLSRRDFTINAMAYDLVGGDLVDPFKGRDDIRSRLIRAVGDPRERFHEDGLRPLRAVRFAAQLGFDIDEKTLNAIPPSLDRLAMVSAERSRDEVQKILLSPIPSRGLRLMESTGILGLLIPELAACRGVEQKGNHIFDVLDHLFACVDAIQPDIVLRLAALLHDIGKPHARLESPGGEISFHRHEFISADLAETILRRMRFPNTVIDEVSHLIREHMFAYDDSWSDAAIRRFIARVGVDSMERLLDLRVADGCAIVGRPIDPRTLEPLRDRIRAVLEAKQAFGLADLAVKGGDLASIGVPPGPAMGAMLKELLETVMDDPSLNERQRLLSIAERLKGKYGLE